MENSRKQVGKKSPKISLHGLSLEDVAKGLLNTKPVPKKKGRDRKKKKKV